MRLDMHRLVMRLGASAAAWQFRAVGEQWIFRAPPWILVRRPHYLVNEAQKARIETILGMGLLVEGALLGLLCMFIVVPSLLPNALLIFNDFPFSVSLYGLLLSALSELWKWVALRPVLRRLPLTAEQITFAERIKPALAWMPTWYLISVLLVMIGTLLFSAHQLLATKDAFSYLAVTVASGALIYCWAVLREKLRSSRWT